jgi:AraC-like DNA-binding protein
MSQKSSAGSAAKPVAVGPSPIESILLVEFFRRERRGWRFEATSLPGHLIHLVVSGEVEQECNGRQYRLRRGDVIWYNEDELVRGSVLKAPWCFYSVNFLSRALPPPGYEGRLIPRQYRLRERFEALRRDYHGGASPLARSLRSHSLLLEILAELVPLSAPGLPEPCTKLWWQIETVVRRQLDRQYDLRALAELAGRSPATVARACRQAVGVPPMKRLKEVRMSLARGLVRQSAMSISEIAARVGYERVHELSRDYRKQFGVPPTAERRAG